MRLAAVVLALAGCSRVLGLDDIPVDQNALSVTGSLTTRRVLNSATRLPFVADDAPVGHPPASTFVELDDGTAVTLTWHADDTFFFDREHVMQGYRLVFPGTFDQPTVEYQLTDSVLDLLDRAWGRADSQRVTDTGAATVSYTFSPNPPVPGVTGFLFLDSTGLWTQTPITALPGNESFTYPWASATAAPAAQPIGLLDTTYNDRLYYAIYTLDTNASTYQLTHYRFDDLSLSTTTPTTVTNQPVYAVQPDSCVLVRAPRAQESMRIANAGYGTIAQASSSWRLLAVPVLAMGTDISFLLAFDTGPTDIAGTPVSFGTPFAGYDLSLEMVTYVAHAIALPGASPFTLTYGSDLYVLPQASAATSTNNECMMQQAIAFTTVQLPTAPLLDGFPLTRGQPTATPIQLQLDRTRLAKLTWTTTQQGALPELYRADLFEVYADTSNTTQLRPHATWYTTNVTPDGAPQVLVDPALLVNGKTYVIEIENVIGQPRPQDSAVALHPYSNGFMYSDMLQVTN